VLERPPSAEDSGQWRSAAFSSMLIGTSGGNALSVEGSVDAIVRGALQANRVLRQRKLWDRVRIDAVEFIECYEDKAIEAAHAVQRLRANRYWTDEVVEELDIAPHLRTIEGALYGRRVYRYEEAWWRRLQISAISSKDNPTLAGGLKYVALTDRARAEETLQVTQRKLIDEIVDRAIHEPNRLSDLTVTLFELLVPNRLKPVAQEVVNLQLILDRHSAQYPWELLAMRSRDGQTEPLATEIGILRQLVTQPSRERVEAPRGNFAMIIGDPDLGNDPAYAQLAGAAKEAAAIEKLLADYNFDVSQSTSIREKALDIVRRLFANEYRILHIAGHGVYDPATPENSGVVIGQGIFLTAAEIEQLTYIPELVFLNCCHLATVDEAGDGQATK
ncbi:MAG: CHAT domain-containing protein, partial [Caldilineaceae bacterium]|nr:CHAT domain-containing protein [Caldilineaceae bacterium]